MPVASFSRYQERGHLVREREMKEATLKTALGRTGTRWSETQQTEQICKVVFESVQHQGLGFTSKLQSNPVCLCFFMWLLSPRLLFLLSMMLPVCHPQLSAARLLCPYRQTTLMTTQHTG